MTKAEAISLKAGDIISLSGIIYVARDAAHMRMQAEYIKSGKLPVDLEGQTIFYAGPTPARAGAVTGSIGPTTSSRMDFCTPLFLELGLKCMIGKGNRSDTVIESMKKNGAVYLVANGGAAALIAQSIVSSKAIAYEELGAEALHKLEVKELRLIVAIDAEGNNLFVKSGGDVVLS